MRVHFSRDGLLPVCGAVGRNPDSRFLVTNDRTKVTCRRAECLRAAGAPENYSPWRDDYEGPL